jgi:hypothetical protein
MQLTVVLVWFLIHIFYILVISKGEKIQMKAKKHK